MGTPLHVLLVEDNPDDATLVLRELRRGGYDPVYERVDTPEGMRAALVRGDWEFVISDFVMPRFSGKAAMQVLHESGLDLPFIIISGTIGEETAVAAMRAGADDYLMKGRLARLGPVVERELQEANLRQAHRTAKSDLDRRDAILKAIVDATEDLLRSTDWERSIEGVLASLGRALGVSRVFVFENSEDEQGELLVKQRHEWAAPGVEPWIANPVFQRFPMRAAGFARWEEALRRGESLHGCVRDLPQGERDFLEAEAVRAFAVVPIVVGEEWWGSLGFHDCHADREWTAAELDALRTAARTLGAAIQRRHVEEDVQRQLRRLAGLRAITLATTATLDLGVILDVFLEHATAQLGVDAANVLLFRSQASGLEYAASRGFRTAALQYTRLRLGEGLAGRVALEGRPVSVADLNAGPRSLGRSLSLREEGFVVYYALPLVAKGHLKGVLELFHRSALDLNAEWLEFAHTLAGQAAVAIDGALLVEDLQRSHLNLNLAYDTTLEGWSRALDLRDHETEGHTQRVTALTLRLTRALGMSEAELVHVRRGALLHDIGKMGIPDRILRKPGPLSEEEWELMRLHPVYAYELLSPIQYLRPALDIPYCHHEKWDGTGYPRALKGETIPLAARAFAVVDVWDALRSDRPYRAAWEEERVREHVRHMAGAHFDPGIVEVFLGELAHALSLGETAQAGGLDPSWIQGVRGSA